MYINYKKISFNIKDAKSIYTGSIKGKIVTEDGRNVHIYDFNFKSDNYPICGVISNNDGDHVDFWNNKGENMHSHFRNLMLEIETTRYKIYGIQSPSGRFIDATFESYGDAFNYKNRYYDSSWSVSILEIVKWNDFDN